MADLKIRLDRFLANQLSEVSRSQIQKDIAGGLVTVNKKKITESKFVVRLGDQLVYHPSSITPHSSSLTPTNTPLKILYNNHGLLIIDKPAGMTVHPGAGFKGETLASALLYHFKDIQEVGEDHRPGIVHRLDKETSGVILVAKSPQMYEYLKNAFLERKIKKEYIALVHGKLEKSHGIIETPIGRSKIDFRKYTTKNPIEAKKAVTEYQVLEHLTSGRSENRKIGKSDGGPSDFSDVSDSSGSQDATHEHRNSKNNGLIDNYTLVMVKLHTGRTHQIRVHFAALGFPLVGDSLYGNKKFNQLSLGRQFLHAKRIEVQLPDKTWIEAESDFPEDLKKSFDKTSQ